MERFSISFTLGKARVAHGANTAHNNRTFLAENIHPEQTEQNISYKVQPVETAYQILFGKAVEEYNAKQTRPCRQIKDYYSHIADGKREEPFYEAVVQFGDCKTVSYGSTQRQAAATMLDEYMKTFSRRNPNLYVFNAVLHMDEASPHLHIDFIPFYTQARQRGLSKGVSMRAALIEQGFVPKAGSNQLKLWEESERTEMEKILHRHGYEREQKHDHLPHMDISEYKAMQDSKRTSSALRRIRIMSGQNRVPDSFQKIEAELRAIKQTVRRLEQERDSPYRTFFFSSDDKLVYMQGELQKQGIPYRESEHGFEAQECYLRTIQQIEQGYQPPKISHRAQLRDDIDNLLMQSATIEECMQKLQQAGYEVKRGKYLAVRPKDGERFIRLKSLGAEYSEGALKARLFDKKKLEQQLEKAIQKAKQEDAPNQDILLTIKLYMVTFSKGRLPMNRREPKKPFSWRNDADLDRILAFNHAVNQGETLASIRHDLAELEKQASEVAAAEEKASSDLKYYYRLKESIAVVFMGKQSPIMTKEQAQAMLRQTPSINHSNYQRIDQFIENEEQELRKIVKQRKELDTKLKEKSDFLSVGEKILGKTYVLSLFEEKQYQNQSDYIPNGYYRPNTVRK